MRLEVLVSTMYQRDYDLIKKMNIKSDAVIINQCEEDNQKEFYHDNYRIKWIVTRHNKAA